MTPNCGIRRTVCVPVGTPKSAVLGFILTRKHASKYKNSSCTPSLVWLKYKMLKTYQSSPRKPITYNTSHLECLNKYALHCFLILLQPTWCWFMDLHIYSFGLCSLPRNSIIHSAILPYLICHNWLHLSSHLHQCTSYTLSSLWIWFCDLWWILSLYKGPPNRIISPPQRWEQIQSPKWNIVWTFFS